MRACGAKTKPRQRARGCNTNSSDRCVNNNWTVGTLTQISVSSTINVQRPDKSELPLPQSIRIPSERRQMTRALRKQLANVHLSISRRPPSGRSLQTCPAVCSEQVRQIYRGLSLALFSVKVHLNTCGFTCTLGRICMFTSERKSVRNVLFHLVWIEFHPFSRDFISCLKRGRGGSAPDAEPCCIPQHARPSLSIRPYPSNQPRRPSFLPLRRSLAHPPAGVMLRCSLLTFPGLAAEPFQSGLFMQTLLRWRWKGQEMDAAGR